MDEAELRRVVASMPGANLREAINYLMKEDPVLWSLYHRRVRGNPLIFDNAHALTPEALAAAKQKARSRQAFGQDLKARLVRHRPFLIEPMRDDHPHKTYQKARQMGVSEASYNEELHFLSENANTQAVHTFPRDAGLKRFVQARIDPSFEETPAMRKLIPPGGANGVYMKRIRDSYLHLTSAWDANLGEGIAADMVTLDEKDRMNPNVDVAFRESLKSSQYNRLREVSTPTLPTVGVARTYALSDQREWFVRCSKCNLEQPLVYPDNVVAVKDVKMGQKELEPGTYEFMCRLQKCRGLLNRMSGRWIALKPSVTNVRGYHMSHLMCPWISATELMQSKINLIFPQLWTNYELGLPSTGEGDLLTEKDFQNACAEHEVLKDPSYDEMREYWTDVCVGIDWGQINWVTIVGRNRKNHRRYVIGIGYFEDDPTDPLTGSAKAVVKYILPFRPDVAVADDGFGKDRNPYVMKALDGTRTDFFVCRYNANPTIAKKATHGQGFQPVWNKEGHQVLVHRNTRLKMFLRSIKEGELGLPSYESEQGSLLRQHVKALVPRWEIDEDAQEKGEEGNKPVEVIASSGPDHLAHCGVYCSVGEAWLEKEGRVQFG